MTPPVRHRAPSRNLRIAAPLSAFALLAIAAPAWAEPQVLIIPFGDPLQGDLAAAPPRFDAALADVVRENGGEPLTARVGSAEIAAIMGCADAESNDCFEESATTLGVDRILVGRAAQQDDGHVQVSLTYFEAGKPVRRKQFVLASDQPDPAAEEVRAAARELIGGPPEPPPPPPPEQQPPPPPPPPAGFSFGRVRPWTWGVAGGGVALIGLGALFLALASDKQAQVDAAPTDTLEDLRHLEDLERSGRRLTLLGNVGVLGGTVALITGAVLIWRQGRAPANEQPAMAVVPLRGGLGLVWSGTLP